MFNRSLAKEPLTGVLDMVKVVVRGPKNALELDCPDLAAVGEPFVCTFTSLRGSGSKLTLLTQETGLEHTYTLPGKKPYSEILTFSISW